MYRMCIVRKSLGLVALLSLLSGCAGTGKVVEESDADDREPASSQDANIREPSSLVGNVDWLNDVQDDFSRIADETSSRAVASKQPDILLQKPRWTFLFHPNTNKFTLRLDGKSYGMVQTSIDDSSNFSFAAEGQTETPITLSVSLLDEERAPAQAGAVANLCTAELSFWDSQGKRYQKDSTDLRGERCARVIEQMRSFVP